MKRINLLLAAILVASVAWMIALTPKLSSAAPNPPEDGSEVDPGLSQALQDKLDGYQSKLAGADEIGYKIDTLIPSADGSTALLWLAPIDNATGAVIETEPALAIGVRDDSKAAGWRIIFQSDPEWNTHLASIPREQLPSELQEYLFVEKSVGLDSTLNATIYRGYKLPWAASVSKRLSGSIGHFLLYNSCSITSCRYAYDFADGTMFPLLAAKGGDVWMANWTCPNGDTSCNNFIVIRDQSTTPTTYQLYLHMAYNSIPAELRVKGATVMQGQFIGNVDDTGASTGHHLHFHVHTNSASYWGNSVDIRFDDVSVNDGTPRRCSEASAWPEYGTECSDTYISGNVGANPATAIVTAPANGAVIDLSTFTVTGTAVDDRGVTKIQVIGRNQGGQWVEMGTPATSSPFSITVDSCSGKLSNGLVDIAVRVFDLEGNISVPQGVRSMIKSYSCTPPAPGACTPTTTQIAIYSEPNYLGVCSKLNTNSDGAYSSGSFGSVGPANIASIQVGSSVRAIVSDASLTYYTGDSSGIPIITGSGRIQGFEVSDPNLADDPIGSDTINSIIVQPKNILAAEIDDLKYPVMTRWTPSEFTTQDSFGISFFEPGGVVYKAWVQKWNGTAWADYRVIEPVRVPGASLGSLLPGKYRFLGCAKNSYTGTGCGNTTPAGYEFNVTAAPFANTTVKSVPYSDLLDSESSEWTRSGLWRWSTSLSESRKGYIYNNGTNFNTGTNHGSLTSPLIQVPAGGAALTFQYRYATESSYAHWDQRWVQIAEDGGEFVNILQLFDDPANYWLNSPQIDLSAYAGKKIRVRFFFFSVDQAANTGTGWQIDSVTVSQTGGLTACEDANNSLATATAINLGQHVTGQQICPVGDVDYFKFSGSKGDILGIWIDAMRDGSTLDPVLALLDANGSLIYENDDQVPYEVQDSMISAILPETGSYYLKVKAWDHPGAGGEAYTYSLHVFKDSTPPVINILSPDSVWPTSEPFDFVVDGRDGSSRIMQMDFYWHPADWQGGTWELMGSDYLDTDGWSMRVDPAGLGDLTNSALYVEARDAAGNISGDIMVATQVDGTPPTVSFTPLPAVMQTTVVELTFAAADFGSGLASVVLQFSTDGNTWNEIPGAFPGDNHIWFVGEQGLTYQFRVLAQDNAGNQGTGSTSTQVAASCTNDSSENADDTAAGAPTVTLGQAQEHNFCGVNDADWIKFNAEGGKRYAVTATSLGGGAAFRLELRDASGANELASAFSSELGQSASLFWTAPASGTYTVKVEPVVGQMVGSDVRYSLKLGETVVMFFPIIGN